MGSGDTALLCGKMVRQHKFRPEQLNYFKFASIVADEFPKALRQTFKFMWDNNYGPAELWDDSEAVRNSFLAKERFATKVPTQKSYKEWDCTALYQATIFAQSFAVPDSTGSLTTLSEMYVKPRGLYHGSFHTSVVSPGGNNAETFALAIDQLRLLRNSFCHLASSAMDKTTLDQYVQRAIDAFQALGLKTDQIDAIGSSTESDFTTEKVARLERQILYLKMALGIVLFD